MPAPTQTGDEAVTTMTSWHTHPRFFCLLGLLLAADLGIAAWLPWEHRNCRLAQRSLAAQMATRAALLRQRPAPTAGNLAALAADLEKLRAERHSARLSWNGGDAEVAPGAASLATRTAVHFERLEFTEHLRQLARQAGVAIRTDEQFGLDTDSPEGADIGGLARLREEQREIGALLPVLFAAGPRALVGVELGDSPAREPEANGFPSGFVTRIRERLTFTGQTLVLRRFLNALAGGPHPWVVRQVEVAPAEETAPGGATAPDWVVAHNLSRFVVTVETIRWDAGTAPSQEGNP
jgi:hypothetical protein